MLNESGSLFVRQAVYNIYSFCMNQIQKLYWFIPVGAVINLPWPTHPTSDPNDCWREYLEDEVGRQGVLWDWRVGNCNEFASTVDIKFLRKKDAVIFALKYGS